MAGVPTPTASSIFSAHSVSNKRMPIVDDTTKEMILPRPAGTDLIIILFYQG